MEELTADMARRALEERYAGVVPPLTPEDKELMQWLAEAIRTNHPAVQEIRARARRRVAERNGNNSK
jgi:hypothetical protein